VLLSFKTHSRVDVVIIFSHRNNKIAGGKKNPNSAYLCLLKVVPDKLPRKQKHIIESVVLQNKHWRIRLTLKIS